MNALAAAGWGVLAAFSLVIGAWLALRYHPAPPLTGRILGFGAGALIAAVAYELVPAGHLESAWNYLFAGVGAAVFLAVDGIPESLVLGTGLAVGGSISIPFLAAVFVSDLPESLGAGAGMRAEGQRPGEVYRTWWGITAVAAGCAALGYGLVQLFPASDGYVEAFAAGAVLTMLANSMIPESFQPGGRLTGRCTVVGFTAAGGLSLQE
jgi:ZIP family zinc transporter